MGHGHFCQEAVLGTGAITTTVLLPYPPKFFEASSQCVATSYDSKFSETDEKAFKEMITPVL